jgi:CBS domain-containing protein
MAVDMKVKDVMSNRVVTCAPGISVAAAAKIMRDEDVGSIIICDSKKPIGIATREDITNKVAAADKQASKVLIKEIMNSPVVSAAPDDTLSEVAKRMSKYGYERLPIKQLNKIVGFVSVRDLLRVAPGLLDMMKEHMDKEQMPELTDSEHSGECENCGTFSEDLRNVNDKWVCGACREEAEENEAEEYDKD